MKLLAHPIAFAVLGLDQPVGGVVLEDVGDIGHGFRTDLVGGDELDVVEPAVGVKPTATTLVERAPDMNGKRQSTRPIARHTGHAAITAKSTSGPHHHASGRASRCENNSPDPW